MTTKSIKIKPAKTVMGTITVPGDKSISHRAVMLSAIAVGTTRIEGYLAGEDNISTINAFRAMGVPIDDSEEGVLIVHGKGLHGLTKPKGPIDCGNSGTTVRLISGILVGQDFDTVLTGDASLRKRPMLRIIKPLLEMGAKISGVKGAKKGEEYLPITIKGLKDGEKLTAIDYESPVASAQVKSAILLAGLYADGVTYLTEPEKSRDHTERMLRSFGVGVEEDSTQGKPPYKVNIFLGDNQILNSPKTIKVPGDISSGAFFMAAAVIVPSESFITITDMSMNPTRTGFMGIITKMMLDGTAAPSAIADVEQAVVERIYDNMTMKYSLLKAIDISGSELVYAIDEFPIICVLAAFAEGVTKITGASELRVKESDRIAVMAESLKAVGVEVEEFDDGIEITGKGYGNIKGGTIDSHGDHRVAMAMAILALGTKEGVTIKNPECVDVSFPGFFDKLDEVVTR